MAYCRRGRLSGRDRQRQLQQPPPPTYAPVPPPRAEVFPAAARWTHGVGAGPLALGRLCYVWRPGHYVERAPQYGRYAEGRWVWGPREGRWIWRPAHWE